MTQQSEEARKRRKIVITVAARGKMLVRFYQGKRLVDHTSFGPRRDQLTINTPDGPSYLWLKGVGGW
jgi:hypothetical protein